MDEAEKELLKRISYLVSACDRFEISKLTTGYRALAVYSLDNKQRGFAGVCQGIGDTVFEAVEKCEAAYKHF